MTSLLFVYNADSGLGNALLDAAHKVVNPSTYACSLCQLTYGTFQEKRNWKEFRAQFHLPMVFLHKDEFFDAHQSISREDTVLPIIYKVDQKQLEVLVEASDMNELESESDLIEMIKARVPVK
jgi:hypothetical protein